MADKEATVYVVDVGKSMGERRHGRDETDLQWAMKYIWDKIATTVGTGRKTLCAGVVALRTNGTDNELSSEDAFEHISVLKPLGQILMSDLRDLREKIKPSSTDDGDAISALVIAIQMIITFCKKLKYTRRIILVTNGNGNMDADGLGDIVSKIKEDNIELIVLGADFDDKEYGFKEEDKDIRKASNEETLRTLVNDCDGVLGTLDQAVSELGIPRIKPVRPIVSYKGYLTLGDPGKYETAMCIDVERYPRTAIAKGLSASNFVIKSETAVDEMSGQSSATIANGNSEQADNRLAAVHNARTYQVKDEDAPGGKRDVERDELAKGYEYGRTAVHIAQSDENVTKLETKAGLDIVGFIPSDNYDHYMSLDKSHTIVAQRTNEKAVMALSSFIHALYELESCAVARLVSKDDKSPSLVLLSPLIESDFECLVEVELPFAEDVRAYKFPPLDRIVTMSGKILKEHRNLPSNDLQIAMGDFVDNMDLSLFAKDEEGNAAEYMPMEDTFTPLLHRLAQVVRYRAVHPTDPVPSIHDILIKFSKPPEELMEQAQPYLDKLKASADVKKVPPRSLSKRRYRSGRAEEKPRSGLDVASLLSTRSAANENKISPENAIPDFRQVLDMAEDIIASSDAVSQLGVIIEDWIRFSLGDSTYDQAVEALGVMRKECIELEEPGLFNDFIRELKRKLLDGELGGDRREMWWKVRGNKLGLIGKSTSEVSDVDEEEAKAFLSAR